MEHRASTSGSRTVLTSLASPTCAPADQQKKSSESTMVAAVLEWRIVPRIHPFNIALTGVAVASVQTDARMPRIAQRRTFAPEIIHPQGQCPHWAAGTSIDA